jgi:hypothetical protein
MRNSQKLLVIKNKRKRQFGKYGSRWNDNIEMHAKEGGCDLWTGFRPPGYRDILAYVEVVLSREAQLHGFFFQIFRLVILLSVR